MTIPKPKLSKARRKALIEAINAADRAMASPAVVSAFLTIEMLGRALQVDEIKTEEASFMTVILATNFHKLQQQHPAHYYAALITVRETVQAMIDQAEPFPVKLDPSASKFDA